jgi:hypothetical protein
MATLTITLPTQRTQTAFNLRRWEELLADAGLARFEGRIETDRHGQHPHGPHPLHDMEVSSRKSPICCTA